MSLGLAGLIYASQYSNITVAVKNKLFMEIPCFTEQTQKDKAAFGIILSVAMAIFISLAYLILRKDEGYIFFGLSAILLFIHAIYCLVAFRGNLIIIFRYLLIFSLSFITAIVWWIFKGTVYLAPFGAEYQTISSTSTLVVGTALSAFGCSFGWFWGCLKKRDTSFSVNFIAFVNRELNTIRIVGVLGALLFGYLYLLAMGGPVSFYKAYTEGLSALGSKGTGIGLMGIEFNIFSIFQLSFISLVIIAISFSRKRNLFLLLAACISLFFGVAAGSRADFLLPILILILFYITIRNRIYPLSPFNRMILLFGLAFFGFLLSTVLGGLRYELSLSHFISLYENRVGRLIIEFPYGHREKMLFLDTANHMIGGMYGFIGKIYAGEIDFLFGKSYIEYILRLPPAFLGLPRPEDLSWLTDISGQVMSQGGVLESAEAYANFGIFGCFFISAGWSYMFNWFLRKSLENNSLFFLMWYLTCGLMLSRAVWYQNFAFVRIASVYLLLGIFLFFIDRRWLTLNAKRERIVKKFNFQ